MPEPAPPGFLSRSDITDLVVAEAKAAGSMTALARRWGTVTAVIYEMIHGMPRVPKVVLEGLGLEAVTFYRPASPDKTPPAPGPESPGR